MAIECSICGAVVDSPGEYLNHKAIYHHQEKAIGGSKVEPPCPIKVNDFKRVNEDVALCTHCGLLKARSAFGIDKGKKNGLQSWCKSCHNAYGAQYHKKAKAAPQLSGLIARAEEKKPEPIIPSQEELKEEGPWEDGALGAEIPALDYEKVLDLGWRLCSKIPLERRIRTWSAFVEEIAISAQSAAKALKLLEEATE